MSNKFAFQTRDRSLSVSFFEKERENDKGFMETLYSASLQRSYRKKNSEELVNENINLIPDELLKVSNLCLKAYNELTKYAQSKKQERQETRQYPAQAYNDPAPYGEPPAYLNDDIPFA